MHTSINAFCSEGSLSLRLCLMERWLKRLAPCALLLGVVLVEPFSSQTNATALDQVVSAETRSNRNWQAFWTHHLGDWRGRWTRYIPTGEIRETFTSSRSFSANAAQTEVVQVNHYRYADGRSIRKEWNYNITEHSLADGFAHPASQSMRGFALDNGSAALLIPTLQANAFAPFELFLKRGEIRHSVGVLYGKDGELIRTASIREQRGNEPEKGWSDSVIQVEPWHLPGRWTGEQRQIHPDLSRSSLQRADWQWTENDQSNHFFPDGIILRCPERLVPGQLFSIRVIWLVAEGELQIITASYDSMAQLTVLTHQSLTPEA